VSTFGNHQIAQFNHTPLVTTLIADANANTGILLELGNELKDVAEMITGALQERQNIATA